MIIWKLASTVLKPNMTNGTPYSLVDLTNMHLAAIVSPQDLKCTWSVLFGTGPLFPLFSIILSCYQLHKIPLLRHYLQFFSSGGQRCIEALVWIMWKWLNSSWHRSLHISQWCAMGNNEKAVSTDAHRQVLSWDSMIT